MPSSYDMEKHPLLAVDASMVPPNEDKLSAYVTFDEDQPSVLTFVSKTAKVQDLKLEALRRAYQLGLSASPADTILSTTGERPAIVHDQDDVSDVLQHTRNNTFSLDVIAAQGPHAFSLPFRVGNHSMGGSGHQNDVRVRWIKAEDAIGNTKLSEIAVHPVRYDNQLTIEDFYDSATRFHDAEGKALKLWSKYGPLNPVGNKHTLQELGLIAPGEPLDIFVHFNELLAPITDAEEPQDIKDVGGLGDSEDSDDSDDSKDSDQDVNLKPDVGFASTTRGVCTFLTSLKLFLRNMDKSKLALDTVLDGLLEITNFPPALFAFQRIHSLGTQGGWRSASAHVQVLAHVCHILCKFMVPDWVCASADSKLEGSRQVLAWIYRFCESNKPRGSARGDPRHLLEAQVFRPGDDEGSDLVSLASFGNVELVSMPGDDLSESTIDMAVSMETLVDGLGKRLALSASFHRDLNQERHHYFMPAYGWLTFITRPKLPLPDFTHFDGILTDTNTYPEFRMIDPLDLGACLSTELPVITLSGEGYLSMYEKEDVGCGSRDFFLWNASEGRLRVKDENCGQTISQQLEPIIEERKKNRSWEVDAWAHMIPSANHGSPDESIVIVIDRSASMGSRMKKGWNAGRDSQGQLASRLDEVKDFFGHFSSRLSAYGLSTHVGLVTFDRWTTVKQHLTPLQLDFCHQLDEIQTGDGTAIFDAIEVASTMLATQKKKFPDTKCRIVILTDGEDNCSIADPPNVCRKLYANSVVLDAIVLATGATQDIFRIARSTGGYAFDVHSQDVFFQIFLLETMVDIRTRPDGVRQQPLLWEAWKQWSPKVSDMQDQYNFPPCRPHPSAGDTFLAVEDANRYFNKKRSVTGNIAFSAGDTSDTYSILSGRRSSPRSSSSSRQSHILMGEVRHVIANVHPNIDVYISQENIGFWKAVIQGPPDSAYEQGAFLLFIDIGPEFPRLPPALRFVTPVLHPNISKHGRVCHPIFDREWSPSIHIYQVLQQVYGIFMSLEARDTIDPIAAFKFYTDPEQGRKQVKKYVERLATRSRAEHRENILGNNPGCLAAIRSPGTSSYDACSVSSANTFPADSDWAVVPRPRAPIQTGTRSLEAGDTAGSRAVRPPPLIVGISSGQLNATNLASIAEGGGETGSSEEDGSIWGSRLRRRRN